MLLTNIRVYLKFLGRNRVYTAINLVGFAAALVFVILLGLYVVDESRADRFHEKGNRIYKLIQEDDRSSYWPAKLGPEIAARYPEIESFVRLSDEYFTVEKEAGEEKIRALAMVADSTFFNVFSFPLASGDPARQLQTASDVTLSEEFATRLFGAEDPVGKSITVNDKPHTVTGVVRKFPKSHLATPDILVRFDEEHVNPWYFSNYNASNFALYLLARPGSDLTSKGDDMAAWFKTFFWIYQHGEDKVLFEPVAESYFNHEDSGRYFFRTNDRRFIALLVAAVLAILLFAIINYVNLSMALGGFRAREAAMRRLLGGSRGGLLATYMLESVVFCAIALATALVLAAAIEPAFNSVMGSEISLAAALRNPAVIATLLSSVVVLGLVSGLSPALVITRVRPIDVVKGDFTRRTRMTYSRLFIGLQFCLTMVLIGCASTIGRQTKFMRTTDLGFDKQNLLYFDNTVDLEQMPGLRDRLMSVPGVEMVSFTDGTPVNGGNNNTNNYEDGTSISFQVFLGDSLLFKILGIDVLSRTNNSADSALWVNQTAARMLDLAPDAAKFHFNGKDVALAGIVNDFHIRNLGTELSPMVLGSARTLRESTWDILVKVSPGNPAETYRRVQEAYLDYNGGEPFDSGFADAEIDSWYTEQRRTGTLISGFSVLAVIISAMGLVAMTTYFMRQRRRDIAVRKVFGATNGQVLGRLVGSFMRIVAVAFVVAVPVVWWLMREWLSSFAYRIPLGWTIFAVAGLSVGAVAFAAVWWQSRMAARRNPVESLKTE